MNGFEYTLRKLRKCLYIYIGETHECGLGIFAAKAFRAGEIVLIDDDGDYYDHVFSYQELRERGYGLDNTLQVGLDAFKMPTGSIDDFTNHSCDPNTGIRLNEKGTIIVALRDIAPHDELSYDYSTYLNNPYERMPCRCGAPECRRVIGSFGDLPEAMKRYYLDWDVVGEFAAHAGGKPTLPDR